MAMRDAQARVTRLRDYRAPDFLIDRTELYFDLRPGRTEVRAWTDLGWDWGGTWSSLKDYQHFSATGG